MVRLSERRPVPTLQTFLKFGFGAFLSTVVLYNAVAPRQETRYGVYVRLHPCRVRAWEPLEPEISDAGMQFIPILKIEIYGVL